MGRAACARIQNTPSIRARVASADRALKTQRLAQTSGSSIESGALWNIQAAFRAFFNEIATGACAKTVWGSMRAEQVSIVQRWRRPRSDPEYRTRRSDTGQAAEKCSSMKRWPNRGHFLETAGHR